MVKNTKPDSEDCHIWALKDGQEVEIIYAESGRGYTCIGCGKEMQAVRFSDPNHLSYFRHHPDEVKKGRECTWSDETYRHKIAKEILVRLRKIKLPAVKKFPVSGDGQAMIIRKRRYVSAHHVESEVYFFHDKQGILQHQKHVPTSDLCDNIVKPDVVFFDKAMNPILFIELVATHKVSEDKRIKLKALEIDTIQVSVPKNSSVAIEKSFHKTTRTKWIYNHEYEQTPYRSPDGTTEGEISSTDKQQRRLFEESVSCRTAEIGSLMRSIKRYLESELYRGTEQRVIEEISGINAAIFTAEIQLRNRNSDLEAKVRSAFGDSFNRLELEEREIGRAENQVEFEEIELDRHQRGVEDHGRRVNKRYQEKIRELELEESQYAEQLANEERSFTAEMERLISFRRGGAKSAVDRRKEMEIDFDREIRTLERTINVEEATVLGIRKQIADLPEKFEQEERAEANAIEKAQGTEESVIRSFQHRTEQLSGRFENLRAGTQSRIAEEGSEIEERYRNIREAIASALQGDNFDGVRKYSEGISKLLHLRRRLLDLFEKQRAYNRLRRAYSCIEQKSYLTWRNLG